MGLILVSHSGTLVDGLRDVVGRHGNVGRAGVPGTVVRLVPVDASGVAVLARRADDHRVPRACNRPAEVITHPKT